MKKNVLLVAIAITSAVAHGQERFFIKSEFQAGQLRSKSEKVNTGIGPSFLVGVNIKGLSIAGGFSALLFKSQSGIGKKSIAYTPVFAEVGLHKLKPAIAPYFVIRAGYGLYDGDGRMVKGGDDTEYKGGLFIGGQAGVSINTGKISIIPVIGLNECSFKTVQGSHKFKSQLYHAGLQLQWTLH